MLRAPSAFGLARLRYTMPVSARATLGLQLRPPGAASARRRGSAAFGRTARPPRASAEPEEERVYVAPNWVSWAPLPASPAAGNRSDALATPPAASPGVPSAGLARLSRADAAGIVMAAAFGLGAPLPSAEQVRPRFHPPCQRVQSAQGAPRGCAPAHCGPGRGANAAERAFRTLWCPFRCPRLRAARGCSPSRATSAGSAPCGE